jgi:hypothetical protein
MLAVPWERDVAAVTAAVGVAGTLPGGILEQAVGDVLDFGQAQLVALVDVDAAREGEGEKGRGPGPAQPEVEVRRSAVALVAHVEPGLLPAVPGDGSCCWILVSLT